MQEFKNREMIKMDEQEYKLNKRFIMSIEG